MGRQHLMKYGCMPLLLSCERVHVCSQESAAVHLNVT